MLGRGGFDNFLFFNRWTDGQWIGGQPQKLNWTTADPRPSKYEYRKALSFPIFEQWLFESVEENFVLAVKSQVLCETNIVTSSLSILMCDCVNDPTGSFFLFSSLKSLNLIFFFQEHHVTILQGMVLF